MTFYEWFEGYAPTAPEILDECAKAAWDAAFRDGYEKGVAAFHEAVAMEREACAKACETGDVNEAIIPPEWLEHCDTDDEEAMTRLYCAAAIRMRSNA